MTTGLFAGRSGSLWQTYAGISAVSVLAVHDAGAMTEESLYSRSYYLEAGAT
ncbi:hypothetical protein ANO14919_029260 [Xylariales sp. No.14919]|nr:hypothetical protein ANO14919_029260 [Xylariales sp. No.14919]